VLLLAATAAVTEGIALFNYLKHLNLKFRILFQNKKIIVQVPTKCAARITVSFFKTNSQNNVNESTSVKYVSRK
jgi:uncharacterized membrane protein YjjB (DUF3815 family)